MARIVGEVRPRYVFVENSPMLASRGLGRVLGDLAALGFDAAWRVLSAADVGAPHRRERIWIVGANADNASERADSWPIQESEIWDDAGGVGAYVANADNKRFSKLDSSTQSGQARQLAGGNAETRGGTTWWDAEPSVGRVADRVAFGLDRLRCIGNGQVPRVAAEAFQELARALT